MLRIIFNNNNTNSQCGGSKCAFVWSAKTQKNHQLMIKNRFLFSIKTSLRWLVCKETKKAASMRRKKQIRQKSINLSTGLFGQHNKSNAWPSLCGKRKPLKRCLFNAVLIKFCKTGATSIVYGFNCWQCLHYFFSCATVKHFIFDRARFFSAPLLRREAQRERKNNFYFDLPSCVHFVLLCQYTITQYSGNGCRRLLWIFNGWSRAFRTKQTAMLTMKTTQMDEIKKSE